MKSELSHRAVAENFGAYAKEPPHLPSDAAVPELAFLAEHRRIWVFRDGVEAAALGQGRPCKQVTPTGFEAVALGERRLL